MLGFLCTNRAFSKFFRVYLFGNHVKSKLTMRVGTNVEVSHDPFEIEGATSQSELISEVDCTLRIERREAVCLSFRSKRLPTVPWCQ